MTAIRAAAGPLARSVADLDLLMRVWCGDNESSGSRAPAASERVVEPVCGRGTDFATRQTPPLAWSDYRQVELARLKFVYWEDDGFFPVAPGIRRAVKEAAAKLASAGAEVQAWQPPHVAQAVELYIGILSADGGADLDELLGDNPLDSRLTRVHSLARMSPPLRWLARHWALFRGQFRAANLIQSSGALSAAAYWRLCERLQQWVTCFWSALAKVRADVFLSPPHALPALTHGSSANLAAAASACFVPNLLDCPAGVVYAGNILAGEESDRAQSPQLSDQAARAVESESRGLPVGVQVAAYPWREDHVLATMAYLERISAPIKAKCWAAK
jgi:fatty acid amide hydrolase